jgi:hypothetical protein
MDAFAQVSSVIALLLVIPTEGAVLFSVMVIVLVE